MMSGVDLDRLRQALAAASRSCDVQARIALDPVGIVRRYDRLEEIELVGLLASSLAFGNVKALRAGIERVLGLLGPDLTGMLDDETRVRRVLGAFRYRMVRGCDVAGALVGARRVQRASGSLGEAFAARLSECGDLRSALAAWVRDIRCEGRLKESDARGSRGAVHILPDPAKASACKRLLLYLRWMIRPNDGVDLGVWTALVSPSVLLIPVDTHIHRIARNLGMTQAASPSWRAAEEITAVLRRIAPDDPVRYDFAMCHLGMSRACPGRVDERSCGCCAIRTACVHHVRWSRRSGS
jgi:uncharacterized protein (TIGR02757 family)